MIRAGVVLALLAACPSGGPTPPVATPPARAVPPASSPSESPVEALLRPAALYRWIRTVLLLEPRVPIAAARLDLLVRELERRLTARSLRARVLRVGGQIAVGLARSEGAEHSRITSALGVRPAFALRLVDDGAPYLAELARRLRPEDGATPYHDGYGGSGGVRVSYTTVESESRDALRAVVVREGRARRIPARRELLLGPRVGTDGRWVLHLVEPDTVVTGEDISDASVAADAGSGLPYVLLVFSSAGSARLESATRRHVGRRLAIVLGDEVLSAPVIMAPIAGGRAQVTLGAGPPDQLLQSARELVLALRAGALPGPLRLVSIEQRP